MEELGRGLASAIGECMLAAPDLFCQAIPCGAIAGRSGRQDPRVRRELSMDDAGLSDERPDTDVNFSCHELQ